MSLTCHLCGLELCREGEGYIALIGETIEQKTARWIQSAGLHMAAMHPHVMSELTEAGALMGYLILASNFRTDEKAIEERTSHSLERTVATVEHLRQELSQEPQRELNLKAF